MSNVPQKRQSPRLQKNYVEWTDCLLGDLFARRVEKGIDGLVTQHCLLPTDYCSLFCRLSQFLLLTRHYGVAMNSYFSTR